MRTPPYHLRKNKAADRFALVEVIRRLPKLGIDPADITYYGFGGPYLEDMRLIYEFCPEIKMVSIEEDKEVFSRQLFHLPCGNMKLENSSMESFLATFEPNDRISVFWLDYTKLEYSYFQDFKSLLTKLVQGSTIKITLRAHPSDYWYINKTGKKEKDWAIKKFRAKFEDLLPHSDVVPDWRSQEFAFLLKQMLQIGVQEVLSAEYSELTFYPISSFYYSDGSWMFTLTGIIWPRNHLKDLEKVFGNWELANLSWTDKPIKIDLPDLSIKERLHLQECLPCDKDDVNVLCKKLGYLIEDDEKMTEDSLAQYAAFHRYFPYFLRGTP